MAQPPPTALLASAWLPFLIAFYWRALQVLFRFLGQATVTSWFRTPEANRLEGGDVESQHLFGLAWDIAAPAELLNAVARAAREAGLIAVVERRHVHLQLFPAGALARVGVTFPE